jgi:putative endopeptidase
MPIRRSVQRPLTLAFAFVLAGLVAGVALAATPAAKAPAAKPATQSPAAKPAASAPRMKAVTLADLDTTCAPCRDFNRYANGGWIDRHDIPAAYATWGSFIALQEANQEVLHGILDIDAADTKPVAGSAEAKLGAYWCACMDSAAADRAGAEPVKALLRDVEGMSSATSIAPVLAQLHDHGISGLFAFRAGQDPRHSDWQIANAGQGGIGLPDRDYYLRTDSASTVTRRRYLDHIAKTLTLLGDPADRATASADAILGLETSLAQASMTNVQRRDPTTTYHKMTVDSLARICPTFDWKAYLGARGIASIDSINVTQPEFMRALGGLLTSVPLQTWRDYLRWNAASDAAPMLGREFADEDFHFNQVLSGAEVQLPRWKRCLRWADRDLGDLLGKAYVEKKFPPAARERALDMVHNLEAALGDRIQSLDWMGPETRTRALEKLHAFEEKIGYPNTWRDYAGVTVAREGLLANHYASAMWESKRNLTKIGKPVDRGEWTMTPPTVNAFYSASLNSINFPAGILQPPFFDPAWDDAANYGGIGAVIGHEMTHGFDDRGRLFDSKGNLNDWWTPEDAKRYKERSDKVADQFSGYTVLDTLHLNGRLTLGENTADLGGIAVAYHALEKALAKKPVGKIDGFTPQQRFFLSYARVWASKQRPAALRTQVQTNPHSPAVWRVNGPLSNLPEFREAFGCKEGDPMVRPADLRARLW